MNMISFFISSLQEYAFRFEMWLAAMSLRYEYETNIPLREFNTLDTDDFEDWDSDV
jgi:hypothetical protein